MLTWFNRCLPWVFPSRNDKLLRDFGRIVVRINELEPRMRALDEAEFPRLSAEFRTRLEHGETLAALLPEAFALVREVSRRTRGERHFDVQLIAGIAMHQGMIAEQKTGEGKTLSSTAPAYLNALSGQGVHIVTPNDYLARRDSRWMSPIYTALGMQVGEVQHGMDDTQRRAAYAADLTYGTNNEFGFDYLRDNMKFHVQECVQRGFHYAIVDEVDSILVDEARTPLIISGPTEESTEKYTRIHKHVRGLERELRKLDADRLGVEARAQLPEGWEAWEDKDVLVEGDYSMDEKSRTIVLSEQGAQNMADRLRKAKLLNEGDLFDLEHMELLHHVNQALKAVYLFKRDVDYVVKDDQVVIVDEFTGRLMPGRRFSDGLHQALEAKEKVRIERESQTYASITFQNYFRMYDKLAGMTGTAKTEEQEFIKIYNVEVLALPTNMPMVRHDRPDVIYKTQTGKQRAIVRHIEALHESGQPVLVGTISIEASEELGHRLREKKVPHTVLNAKYHEQEAEIIAQAGECGRVTIATNMAGRGTDIKLGPGAAECGGLCVIGTERHESRRIDNQLRGRSGRQGDPGFSQFYLSLEDNLMRIFGGERIARLMTRLHVEEDEAITHGLIGRAIENAQKRVEAHHFEMRKHVLEYDDVMNRQREIIYAQRRRILSGDVEELLLDMADETLEEIVLTHAEQQGREEWDVSGLKTEFRNVFGQEAAWNNAEGDLDLLRRTLMGQVEQSYQRQREAMHEALEQFHAEMEQERPELLARDLQRQLLLSVHDSLWKDHLLSMDYLREGIGLVGYAQKKPIDEYKREGFAMFQTLMRHIARESVSAFFRSSLRAAPVPPPRQASEDLVYSGGEADAAPLHKRRVEQGLANWGRKRVRGARKRRRAS